MDEPVRKNPCDAYHEECQTIRCPYGTEGFVDQDDCNRCRCYDPCRGAQCPTGTRCAIDLNPNAAQPNQTQFVPVCRPGEQILFYYLYYQSSLGLFSF